VTLHTPMPLIELALEGKYAFLRAISGIADEPETTPDTANGPLDLMAHLRRRAAQG
jgi:hypothetical protein